MTAPEDQNGLREALARAVEAGASNGRTTTEIVDDLFVAGPLASLIAERDAAVAGLAQATANIEKLSAAIHDAAPVLEVRDRAAEAEITRLKEGMEAAVGALTNVRSLISEAAMTGFNHADGDWPERLFYSQQRTSHVLRTLSPKEQPHD